MCDRRLCRPVSLGGNVFILSGASTNAGAGRRGGSRLDAAACMRSAEAGKESASG